MQRARRPRRGLRRRALAERRLPAQERAPFGWFDQGRVVQAQPGDVGQSRLPGGLLPTSQWAMRLHRRLGRHAYEGLALGAAEQARLVANLGTLDGLILENHGPLTVGRSVAEAWMLMYILERAAQAQLAAMAATGGHVRVVDDELATLTYRQWIGAPDDPSCERDGDIEWPALLRGLDRTSPGYRD